MTTSQGDDTMRTRTILVAAILALGGLLGWPATEQLPRLTANPQAPPAGTAPVAAAQPAEYKLDRTVLPIPEPRRDPITILDARKAKASPRFEVKAPKGAPNVVIVLIDDMGFGQSSAFGGPVQMPTCEKLAASGLKYNRFHTTALCSPTRMALLTGRNHHSCNTGSIMDTATAFP